MKIIDGNKIAAQIESRLQTRVKPGTVLAILVLSDDKAGQTYTRLKQAAALRLGITVVTGSDAEILDQWAADPAISGILIQYPGWRGQEFAKKWQSWVNKIPPQKDVDGLRPDSPYVPATVKAVETLIPPLGGILVVGRGMVGRALAKRLRAKNISSHDKQLTTEMRQADVLITACGRPGLIWQVKPGAVVIDCGWPEGEVDFQAVRDTAAAITPVPGGVGPVTVACLLENLVEAVYNRL